MNNQIQPQNHIIWKLTDFFADEKRYKSLVDEYSDSLNIKTDIELQCLGYGLFRPEKASQNFWSYLQDIFNECSSVKSLKIVFNGFSLKNMKYFNKLFQSIRGLNPPPKTLWIHTSHLRQCTVQDFQSLLRIAFDCNDNNLEDISLQFSNWSFIGGPLLFDTIKKVFIKINESHSSEMSPLLYKKYRLEMSGWYYHTWEAKKFLNFVDEKDVKKIIKQRNTKNNQIQKQIEKLKQQGLNLEQGNIYNEKIYSEEITKFHSDMVKIIKTLLYALTQVEDFQIDFRGWNEILKMKELKKGLDNIKKLGRSQGSIIKRKNQQHQQNQQKQLRMNFVM